MASGLAFQPVLLDIREGVERALRRRRSDTPGSAFEPVDHDLAALVELRDACVATASCGPVSAAMPAILGRRVDAGMQVDRELARASS